MSYCIWVKETETSDWKLHDTENSMDSAEASAEASALYEKGGFVELYVCPEGEDPREFGDDS